MVRQRVRGTSVVFDGRTDATSFATYRARMTSIWDVRVTKAAERTFEFAGTTWQLPHAFLNRSAGSGQTMLRTRALISSSPLDHIQIFRLDKGQVAADYDGRQVDLRAGDIVVLDYMRPMRSKAGAFASSSLLLARDSAPARFKDGELHGCVLAAASPAGRLLGRHLDAVFDLVGTLALDEAEAAVGALFALAAALWSTSKAGSSTDDDDLEMFDRAVAMIVTRLGDPKLIPPSIAQALGISRTRLYTLFEPHGGVSAMIQKTRLDASLKALVAEPVTPGLVADVAGRFGFKSLAHFSRAFTERFGRSPRKVATLSDQSVGGLEYTAWLEAQSRLGSSDMIVGWLDAIEAEIAGPKQRGSG